MNAKVYWTEMLPDPLPADPLAVAADWLAQARIDAAQPNPNAMVLATVDGAGQPSLQHARGELHALAQRLAGGGGETRGEIGFFKDQIGRAQRATVGGREDAGRVLPVHLNETSGLSPLRLAMMAEPLEIKAVVTGLIRPLGKASASATVFMPTTMA